MPTGKRKRTAASRRPRPRRSRAGRRRRRKRRAVKLTYKDQRDYDRLPARIEELDAAIARDEAALADPDLYTRDPKRFDALMAAVAKARATRTRRRLRWLELAEMVEGLTGS